MNKKIRWSLILISIILFVFLADKVFMFMVGRNQGYLPVPEHQDLENIVLIDVKNDIGIEKTVINKPKEINRFLEIFADSNRTYRESVSDFPDKTNFTAVLFNFGIEESSWRSLYREGKDIYIDQPYYRVFKVRPKDIDELGQIIERGIKENILISFDDILKKGFK
ncbi:MAG: DUF5301 domain-containing protein [Tissierella sp.]|uniref:DUF5301 domain-containing protein n=1 Tax=Tissierella sp. TaxID=41274 RepID=UPI003F9C1F3F